jgi:putative transposase
VVSPVGGVGFRPVELANPKGHVLGSLDLSIREWRCPSCQQVNGRDENAAKNIQAVGASTVGLSDVRQAMPAVAV